MVSLSITNIIELFLQIIISLIIATLIIFPAFFIYNGIKRWRIKRKVPVELKVKGGSENGISKRLEKTTEYPTADTDFLRKYTERRFFSGNTSSRNKLGAGEPAVEGRFEFNDIKREIESSGGIQSPDNSNDGANQQHLKRTWGDFK